MAVSEAGREVLEDDADPRVKKIYDEIKATLRFPLVNVFFRTLAAQPDYLELAWRQLQPSLLTVFFEEQANTIRARAVHLTASMGAPPKPPSEAAEVLRAFHYLNPKLLLVATILRGATGGQRPVMRILPAGERRPIAQGVPQAMPQVDLIDPDNAGELAGRVFADIARTLNTNRFPMEYRALARWPEYFGWAWQTLKPNMGHPEYKIVQRELRLMAEEAVLSLPFRVDLGPHTLRLCGLSESDIDWVRATLEEFYAGLPGLVANIAFLAIGADGEIGAAKSPFPVSLS
jgi:hypothetical protein